MNRQDKQEPLSDQLLSSLSGKTAAELEDALRSDEKEILRELAIALRTIRYGSIVLVIHEGRLVEVTKTVRIRKASAGQNERRRE